MPSPTVTSGSILLSEDSLDGKDSCDGDGNGFTDARGLKYASPKEKGLAPARITKAIMDTTAIKINHLAVDIYYLISHRHIKIKLVD